MFKLKTNNYFFSFKNILTSVVECALIPEHYSKCGRLLVVTLVNDCLLHFHRAGDMSEQQYWLSSVSAISVAPSPGIFIEQNIAVVLATLKIFGIPLVLLHE